jgi:ariadne-1
VPGRGHGGDLRAPVGPAGLRCRWDVERLKDEWFSDEGRVHGAVGLAAAGRNGDVPTVFNTLPLTCAICFGPYSPSEMRSAGCSHYYCHECWRNFIRAVVGDGLRCLLMRCPDPGCSVPVVRELVDAAAAGEVRARYNMFVVCRSWRRARASTSGGAPVRTNLVVYILFISFLDVSRQWCVSRLVVA